MHMLPFAISVAQLASLCMCVAAVPTSFYLIISKLLLIYDIRVPTAIIDLTPF